MQDIIFAPITRDAAVHPLNETRESDSNRLIDESQSKETNIDRQKFILLFSNIVSRISTFITYAYKDILIFEIIGSSVNTRIF